MTLILLLLLKIDEYVGNIISYAGDENDVDADISYYKLKNSVDCGKSEDENRQKS